VTAERVTAKPRVIVLTDISTLAADHGEPDDTQSMVRLMLYACDLDIEGLVASSNMRKGRLVHDDYVEAVVRAYGMVRENLVKHRPDFPTADHLLSRIKRGNPHYGVDAVGEGCDTEASDWIISVVDRPDPRPVWVTVWGGTTDLAQALWRVGQDRGDAGLRDFVARMRVHAIADQDDTGPWIKDNHPGLLYITSRQVFRGMYKGGEQSLVTREWVRRHVTEGHGALGAAYPNYDGSDPWGPVKGVKEGDTPSFLYLIPNGLSEPEHPTWGSWGGRFERDGAHYGDAEDSFGGEIGPRVTVSRWRRDYQAAFQARMTWCHLSPQEANHEPVAAIAGESSQRVRPGETVVLDARESCDPDGDPLDYRWWVYGEAGTYRGGVEIEGADNPLAHLIVPTVERPETLHIVLTVTDRGEPPLSAYGRVVLSLEP